MYFLPSLYDAFYVLPGAISLFTYLMNFADTTHADCGLKYFN
jgi:hypothetical protein